MANNRKVVPAAQNALDQMKYEVASQIGVNLQNGYNGNLTSKDAGRIGGSMTKKLVEMAQQQMANK